MNKSLKSIENNEESFKDSKQKQKQITLFDMHSKGKFSISSDNDLSPKPITKKGLKSEDDDVVLLNENEENVQIKNSAKKIKRKKELNNSKINNFFTKSEELVTNKPTEQTSVVKSKPANSSATSDKKFKKITSLVKEIGTLALENSASNLENHMFGEVAVIIELYNLLVDIFNKIINKSKRGKKKPSYKDLDLLKIDLDQFILVFNFYSAEGKAYFVKIIQNILKIFIFHEKIFGYRFPFNFFFDNLTFDPCFLQELTRYILNIVTPQIDYFEINSEVELLYSQEKLLNSFPLIKELATNYSEEPFGDFGSKSKLELMRLLCENLLLTKLFEDFKISLEEDIEKNKIKLKEYKNEISDLFVSKDSDSGKKVGNPIKMAKRIQSRPAVKGKLTKYEKLNTRIKNQISLAEKINRLEPIGIVDNNVYFWTFSFIKGVVVEIKNKNEKNEWYILDKRESIQSVIAFLKKGLICPKLCSELKTILANLDDGKKKDNDNPEDGSEESESEEEKVEKKYSLRNANKSISKAESNEEEDSDDDQLETYLSSLDAKTRMQFMKKLATVSAKFDWIQFNDSTYSIETLWKYLSQQVAKAHYYGITNVTVFSQITSILRAYSNESQFMPKFDIIKKALNEFTELIGHQHIKSLLLKNGRILPNGKKILDVLKEYLLSCQSLSSLYLITYFFMNSVKWTNFRPMKPCSVCKEKYESQDYEKFINEKIFSTEDLTDMGYFTCLRCLMPTHKKCDALREDRIQFVCKDCIEKSKVFDYAPEVDEDNEIEIPSPEKVVKGGKMLRNRKKVNYKNDTKKEHHADDNDDDDSRDASANFSSSLRERRSGKVIDTASRSSGRLRNTARKNYSDN